jgi:hypothetical protein
MAHVARSNRDVPGLPISGPNWGTWAWVLFGVVVAAVMAFGFLNAHGPSLHAP